MSSLTLTCRWRGGIQSFLVTLILALILLPDLAVGQIRAGSAYLKMLPGARQQSLGSGLTAGLDLTYSLYANPGATGFLREWQLSASATKWIADIYNISLLYGTHVPLKTPWSKLITFALGVNYQNVGEFDATRGAQPAVSANDLLVVGSIGMPFGRTSRNFSVGANFKYLRTELAQFNASALVFDFGAIYRFPRLQLSEDGVYAILSAGASLNQVGQSMKFITDETPLPRTFRTGLALNIGKHDGLQLQIAGDYHEVRHEVNQYILGVEVINLLSILPDALTLNGRLSRILAFRSGYNFNNERFADLVDKWSWGFSFRFDDYMNPQRKTEKGSFLAAFPPKNSAFRFDGGRINSQLFPSVYQGSGTLRPLGPERFGFIEPLSRHYIQGDTVNLTWESALDPDLYDDVNYLLMVVKEDSALLDDLVQKSESGQVDIFELESALRQRPSVNSGADTSITEFSRVNFILHDSTFFLDRGQASVNYDWFDAFEPGDYYWAAAAFDINKHARFAKTGGRKIAHFHVKPQPDLTIAIERTSAPDSAYIVFTNLSETTVDSSFSVQAKVFETQKPVLVGQDVVSTEVILEQPTDSTKLVINWESLYLDPTILDTTIHRILQPGESHKIKVPWDSQRPYMFAVVDLNNRVRETDELNNTDLDKLLLYDLELTITADVKPISFNIEFEYNKGTPRNGEEKRFANMRLQAFRRALDSEWLPNSYVEVAGHTDDRGGIGYNDILSNKRANWVKDFFVKQFEFDSTQICAVGYGERMPLHEKVEKRYRTGKIDKDTRDKLHKANRRVEVFLRIEKEPCSTDNALIQAVFPGDTVAYKLRLVNHGPHIAENFQIVDEVPLYLKPLTANIGNWQFDELSVSDTVEVTYRAKVQNNLPDFTYLIMNRAKIIAPNDTSQVNDSDSAQVIAINMPIPNRNFDLNLTGRASADTVESGNEFTYELAIENKGSARAYDFSLQTSFSRYVTLMDTVFNIMPDSAAGNVLFWNSLPAANGSANSINIAYRLKVDNSVKSSATLVTRSEVYALDDTLAFNNASIDTVYLKGEDRIYVVKPGDTLGKIANQFYGNPGLWNIIFAANKNDPIGNPDILEIGWKLKIPFFESSGRPYDEQTSTSEPSNSANKIVSDNGQLDPWKLSGEKPDSDNGQLDLRELLREVQTSVSTSDESGR